MVAGLSPLPPSRRVLGLNVGDDVVRSLEAEEIRILSRKEAGGRAKALVRRYVPEGTVLPFELLAKRRRETADN